MRGSYTEKTGLGGLSTDGGGTGKPGKSVHFSAHPNGVGVL